MSRRTKFNSRMENAVQDLELDYGLYESEFRDFFPQITRHIEDFMKLNSIES